MLVKFVDALIAAATNLQIFVSLSSTETEYVVLNEAVKTIVWLKSVFAELWVRQELPCIFQDSISCIKLAIGGAAKHFGKRKRIDIKHN